MIDRRAPRSGRVARSHPRCSLLCTAGQVDLRDTPVTLEALRALMELIRECPGNWKRDGVEAADHHVSSRGLIRRVTSELRLTRANFTPIVMAGKSSFHQTLGRSEKRPSCTKSHGNIALKLRGNSSSRRSRVARESNKS